jgi:hypothetical protein
MSTRATRKTEREAGKSVTVEVIRVGGRHETAAVDRVNCLKQIDQLIGDRRKLRR